MYPKARREGVLTQEIDEELAVYDQERHLAHRLNRTATLVWRHCDGRRSVAELAQLLGPGKEEAEGLVYIALEELRRAHLLCEEPLPSETLTRRAAVETATRVVGIASPPR